VKQQLTKIYNIKNLEIMKNSIKLAALFLLASTGLFASASAKTLGTASSTTDMVSFTSLPTQDGVAVKVEKALPGNAIVIIYDADGNMLRKDVTSGTKTLEKGYVFNQLENGDYTIEVTTDKQVVKKQIHVYDENETKTFIVVS
jgi:hypothetical protein